MKENIKNYVKAVFLVSDKMKEKNKSKAGFFLQGGIKHRVTSSLIL